MSETKELPPEREAFRIHYEDDRSSWNKSSGLGSHPYFTTEYRNFLEKFIWMNKVKSIVDVGCGDWQFTRFLNLENVNYLGLDVVPSVVTLNSDRFNTKNVKFEIMPEEIGDVPSADLLIMKDVLQHLPDATIFAFAQKVFPKFKFCLLSNSFQKLNTSLNVDIKAGQFRSLDLSIPPYSFRGSYVLEFSSPFWERIRTFLLSTTIENKT